MRRSLKVFLGCGVLLLVIVCSIVIFWQTADESQTKTNINELDINVLNNREDELVFSISIDDFISGYNALYSIDHDTDYLRIPSEWSKFSYEKTAHSNHETYLYRFTPNEKIWSLPTVSVYVPSNSNNIQEITVNFDDHSYSEKTYNLYEEMCFYTLKVLFPDVEDKKIIELYKTLNELAYDNISDVPYFENSRLSALYHKGGIGVYPYFAVGECLHLCVIPVTQQYLDSLISNGVNIYDID